MEKSEPLERGDRRPVPQYIARTSDRWEEYQEELKKIVGEKHQSKVAQFWKDIRLSTKDIWIPFPDSVPFDEYESKTGEKKCVQFSWDNGKQHLDIDIDNRGHISWFYCVKKKHATEGENDEGIISEQLPQIVMKLKKMYGTNKLFKVVIHREILVQAKNEEAAYHEARYAQGNERYEMDYDVTEITKEEEIPSRWRGVSPYGGDGRVAEEYVK